ncbi:MAG: glycoside hydrolase family 2 TIM barrel-domain containing protein [Flavisolibacter sp.]
MKPFRLLFVLLVFSITTHAQKRSRTDFDEDWKFRLDSVASYSDPAIDDASWRTLNLPHDWSIEGSFSTDNPAGVGGGALPGGVGWYRKHFVIPSSQKNKQVFVEFDGVYRNSEVFINGHSLGFRPNGYISFSYELSPYLNFGAQNLIAVKVDNSKQPNSRWYSGSGIFRNVWLTTVDPAHIEQWGSFITTPAITKDKATVRAQHRIHRNGNNNLVLQTTILDASGAVVQMSTTPVRDSMVLQQLTVSKPQLWSLEKPYLYKMVSVLKKDNVAVDNDETYFGIRSFYFDVQRGFFLNGKNIKILGVCDHHDLGALGAAVSERALERQLQILKDMGCNGIRTSHNPPAPELLDLADRMGFVVMDEAFDMWAKPKTTYDYHLYWSEWHKKDLQDQILRDRNHPSIFIWSIGNEIPEQWGKDSSGRTIARELAQIVHELDTTRPITTANNNAGKQNNILLSGALDLIGYNYSIPQWSRFPSDWPGQKLIITESTSALETRGHYDRVPVDTIRRWPQRWDKPFTQGNPDFTVSAYDNVSTPWGSTHEESVKALKKWDFVSGMYIWTGFDYLGEPTPYSWPARSSYFGIIDLAGFPKDVYYMYQSEFTNKPVLHLLPHWNWKTGDTVDVVAYYNQADNVELILNGRSLGTRSKKGDDLHVFWHVPYEPGTLKAVSRINGKTVLSTEVKTSGKPLRLVMKADRNIIKADGKDLSFVTITVVDQNGVMVPDANPEIKFSIEGPGSIAGLDNGDPINHESFRGREHKALNGKALAIVQSNHKKGKIVLQAIAEGLSPAAVTITTQ